MDRKRTVCCSSLFTLPSEAKPTFIGGRETCTIRFVRAPGALCEYIATDFVTLFQPVDGPRGEDVLGAFFPGKHGSAGFDLFAPDEADEDVHAAKREEEECRDEGECVDVMGEDGSSESEDTGEIVR